MPSKSSSPFAPHPSNTLRNHRSELLVKAKSPFSKFIRLKSTCQFRHGLSCFGQRITKFALQVALNTRRLNGLGFDHCTHAFLCVHGR